MSGVSFNTPQANPCIQNDIATVDALPGGLDGMPAHDVVANVVNPTATRTTATSAITGCGFIPASIKSLDGTVTLVDFLIVLRA